MDAETPDTIRRAPLSQDDIRSIFIGLMLVMFLSALDQTIVATAMPTIGRDLGDSEHLSWIVTAYLLTATAVTPLYGKLADMHGRRVVLLVAVGIFMAGSLACALAPSLPFLALARGLQGLGGGGLIALSQTIIGDMVTPRERGRYQGYFGTVFVSASVGGPVLGGFFAESLHWSLIFWINLPLGLLGFLLTNNLLKKLPPMHRPHRLDFLGAGVMICATATLMLGLNLGGSRGLWTSPDILALFGLSALFWAAFAARLLTAREPLIPVTVLADRVVATGTLSTAVVMATYVGLAISVPIYFETVLGLSAKQSGLALLPFMVFVPIGATTSGRVMATTRRYKRLPTIGLAVSILALCGFASLAQEGRLWMLEILLLVASFGIGTSFPVSVVSVQNAVESHHLGTATATINFTRQLAASIIVAIFGAIAFGGGEASLHRAAPAGQVGPAAGQVGPAAGQVGPAAGQAAAFTLVFWLAAAALAIGLAIFLFMEERPFRERAAPSAGATLE